MHIGLDFGMGEGGNLTSSQVSGLDLGLDLGPDVVMDADNSIENLLSSCCLKTFIAI